MNVVGSDNRLIGDKKSLHVLVPRLIIKKLI